MRRATVVLTVLLAVGCGGKPARLSANELVHRADAICADQTRTAGTIPRGPSDPVNAAGYLGALISVVEDGVDAFHGLRPPDQLDQPYGLFLHHLDAQLAVLRGMRKAALKRDLPAYRAGHTRLSDERRRISLLEQRLGFRGCLPVG